jgi:transposase
MRANGGDMVPPVFEGSLNGELFKEHIAQCLAPTLKTGDIVVMDSLSSHRVEGVMEPVIAAGATIRYLPPYKSVLNPIEMIWSKIKAYLRKVKAGTGDLLEIAIADALNLISISDISGWFAEDGYSTQ